MRFVHLFFDATQAYLYMFISQALAASHASAATKVHGSDGKLFTPEKPGSSSMSHPAIGMNKKPFCRIDDFEPLGGSLGSDVLQKPRFLVSLKVCINSHL